MPADIIPLDRRHRRKASPQHADDRDAKNEKALQQRLEDADGIQAAMLEAVKTPQEDREIFARNLGRMVVHARKSRELPFRILFDEAFGDPSAEPNSKKRKRFVVLPDEDSGGDGFTAKNRDYLDLAMSIARLTCGENSDDAQRQAKRKAVLGLVDGSSLDRRISSSARRRQDAVEELLRCADRIVRRIEETVDLDAMRDVIRHDVAGAFVGPDGEIEKLQGFEALTTGPRPGWPQLSKDDKAAILRALETNSHPGDRFAWQVIFEAMRGAELRRISARDLDLWGDDADSDDSVSRLSPRVGLGEILGHAELRYDVITIDYDPTELEHIIETGRQALTQKTQQLGLTNSALDIFELGALREASSLIAARSLAERAGLDVPAIESVTSLDDLELLASEKDGLSSAIFDLWSEEPAVAVMQRRRLELQIRYDPAVDRWRACLAAVLSHGSEEFFGFEGDWGTSQNCSGKFSPAFKEFNLDEIAPGHLGQAFLSHIGQNRMMMFFVEDPGLPVETAFGIDNGCLPLNSDAAIEALLTELRHDASTGERTHGGHIVKADLDAGWNQFAPVPVGTIGGAILRNLAYADDADRYDLALLRDAEHKSRLAAAFAAERAAGYKAAIDRLND